MNLDPITLVYCACEQRIAFRSGQALFDDHDRVMRMVDIALDGILRNEIISALELNVAFVNIDVLGVRMPRIAKQDPFGQNDSP